MSDTLNLMRNEDGDVVNVITSITQEPGSPPMIPNPISKEQNFKKWIKAKAANMRIEQANRRALATVVTEVDA